MTAFSGAKRSLGQHFLVSERVLDRLEVFCREAASGARTVLEIGPGRGALTARLLRLGLPLRAVERDRELVLQLRRDFPGLDVEEGDGRRLDWPRWRGSAGETPLLVAGNLPYNAATEILIEVLSHPEVVCAGAFMVQREVAEKLVPGGDRTRGPLAAFAAAAWEGRRVLEIPPGAFRPPPKVQSSFCLFHRREVPSVPWERLPTFWDFLKDAFAHPRKTLGSAVRTWPAEREKAFREALERAGVPSEFRPAQIPLPVWGRIFASL